MSRTSSRGTPRREWGLVGACALLSAVALIAPRAGRERLSSTLRGSVLAPLVSLEGRAAAAQAAIMSRNAVLTVRGRTVADTLSLQALSDENRAMRRLLGLAARLQDGFVPAEVLPARPGEAFTMALTVGQQSGVQPFLPVVTGDGLVGMVESVERTTSNVITWAHPDFRVSAMSVDQRAFGIVQPHLGTGADRWLLEMRGVPFRSPLDTGTLIVSSGLGATYPRGIPLGTVIGEVVTPEKWARTYLLKPAVLTEATGPVVVLLPSRAQRGVSGVWTSVAAADSAARAAAAAGDSLVRQAAFDELAARRAANVGVLDSLYPSDSMMRVPSSRPESPRVDSLRPRVAPVLPTRPPVPPPPASGARRQVSR